MMASDCDGETNTVRYVENIDLDRGSRRKKRKRRSDDEEDSDVPQRPTTTNCPKVVPAAVEPTSSLQAAYIIIPSSSKVEEICGAFDLNDINLCIQAEYQQKFLNYQFFSLIVLPMLTEHNPAVNPNKIMILVAAKYADFLASQKSPPSGSEENTARIVSPCAQTPTACDLIKQVKDLKKQVKKLTTRVDVQEARIKKLTNEVRQLKRDKFSIRIGELARVTRIWFLRKSTEERKIFLNKIKHITPSRQKFFGILDYFRKRRNRLAHSRDFISTLEMLRILQLEC